MTHIIIRDVALVTDLWCFGSSFGSGAPRMSVAGPSRRLPSCRRRKRLRPGVGWWGSPVRFIVDLGCGYPFLVWFVFLWLLFSGVWETLIFGTGDWFVLGNLSFVACLPQLTHCLGTGSCPNHTVKYNIFLAKTKKKEEARNQNKSAPFLVLGQLPDLGQPRLLRIRTPPLFIHG